MAEHVKAEWHVAIHRDSDSLFRHSGTLGDCQECRVIPPDGTDEANPIIHRPGCSWETTPYCNCGADPERPIPPGGDHA